jgi:fused signal recognition particle receptor
MSGPTWRERLFGGFRKTSERLSENLAAAVATAAPVPDPAAEDDIETSADPVAEPAPAPIPTRDPVAEPAPEPSPARSSATKSPPPPAPVSIVTKVASTMRTARLDDATLDHVEDALIMSDLGPSAAARIRNKLAEKRFGLSITEHELKEAVAEEIAAILRPVAKPLEIVAFPRPQVILVIGVNGSGKTTTIAKLAHLFQEQDYGVLLAAGDTFRAAAIGQLKVWADRIGAPIVTGPEGGDPASVVFDAVKQATGTGIDALIVDTAGRLQNKRELMDELAKIRRVLGRLNPEAPHDVVLVLDATNGQNALNQIDVFKELAGVTGLIMTKLDGTARGGVLVAAAEQYGLPIHAIGVGEKLDDLRPFDPDLVARVIAGVA